MGKRGGRGCVCVRGMGLRWLWYEWGVGGECVCWWGMGEAVDE